MRLAVEAPELGAVTPGESISVSGCCLTLAEDARGGLLTFDVVPETLSRTTLGEFEPLRRVNLERAATLATLMGGHVVQGHVDGVGTVAGVETGREHRLRIAPGEADGVSLMEYMAPKGSVAIDGVSLTLAAVGGDFIEVALIPETLSRTTLGELRPGSRCNIEADVIAKMVVHRLRALERGFVERHGARSGD